MRNDEDAPSGVKRRDVVEGGQGSLLRRFGGFEARRTSTGLEPPGPLGLDLLSGETLPFAGVVLAPTYVDATCRTLGDFGEQIRGHTGAFEITRDHEVEGWAFRCNEGPRLSCL